MELHKEIKRVRKECKYTQEKFAKLLGISRIHYNGLENGRNSITLELLKNIGNITNKQLIITFIDKNI